MKISETQLPDIYREAIQDQLDVYNQGRSIQARNSIPDTIEIPIENQRHWLKIPDVICVFVDMKGSTQLSASLHDNSTAGAFQLFSGTLTNLFSTFEAPYIDIKGDGVFALFDKDQPYRAFASAVTAKTFIKTEFVPTIKEQTGIEVGSHLGIDQKTVLVRKIGYKRYRGRSDRQNEVWAGKPVNMAAKLSGLSEDSELLVSERFFKNINHKFVTKSCGCPNGEKVDLWKEKDLSEDKKFDFDKAYSLRTIWCSIHGKEYCESILLLDKN